MIKIARLIGKEATEELFLERYVTLCRNEEFFIRKITILRFPELCVVVSRNAVFRQLVSRTSTEMSFGVRAVNSFEMIGPCSYCCNYPLELAFARRSDGKNCSLGCRTKGNWPFLIRVDARVVKAFQR